jgi:serine/threonine protein kinase
MQAASLSAGTLDNRETSEWELPAELADHPRYRIVKRVGSGGMGTVYLAEHRLMDRSVALKVIRRDILGNEELVERFRREVQAAARLALHPNIVAAYDAEQAGASHFLAMEFVEGVDLAHLVNGEGPLPCELACQAVKQVAEGLQHAFQHGMVHRDIKPQNLMRKPDGQIKILDFGLARFASETLPDQSPAERQINPGTEANVPNRADPITRTDIVLGTADYLAPEQASSPHSADIRADVYSLGCTLYYLLTGHAPFPDGNLAQKLKALSEQTPKPLTEVRPDVPPELARIVERMMAKDRNRRFQTPYEVAEALAPFAEAKAVHTDTPNNRILKESAAHAVAAPSALTESPGSPARRERRLRITVMGLLGLVALAAVALWFYRSHVLPKEERPLIVATFKKVSPVADGMIGKEEYGPAVTMTWSEGNMLGAFNPMLLDPATQGYVHDPTRSKLPTDLSMEVQAAYTDTALFLAFRVHDQFVDAQESDRTMPMYNDGVEVFIDGDGVSNDFVISNNGSIGTGSREGFQLLVNAAGHQFTASRDFTNTDWKAAARHSDDGYIVEMEIPLALIDTLDGPQPYAPPRPGTVLNLGLAVTDNDAEVSRQMSYAYLRAPNQSMSPFDGQEAAWRFGIKLEPNWSLFPW